MRNRKYYLRRAAGAVILLGILLYHSADLTRLLERALTASPRWQATGIVFLAATVLLARFLCNSGAAVVAGNFGPPVASIPLGGRLGDITTSDLKRWAEIHKNEGESTKDAVKRLEPIWNQRELGEDISIKQRRRHEAAHAVITYILGGTVMSADVRDRGHVGGSVEYLPPIPSAGPAHTMWVRLQIAVAGAAQDTIDGILNAGSSTDIDKALRQAVTLTAAAWTPDGYTGPINPSDLITYAIETNKQLLVERQDAIAAIENALTDKDKLTGIEVHHILDNLNTPHPKPVAEAAG
ncbi:hypothetical protein [Actinomyces oris]|uniref:hypothetical protein n=1 Tax=Actinomyces oris TaxID=544580 RepID=UPI0022FD7CC8|nr:hypothetical protein [Actinomyces oris]WCA42347.1 hypothetical protein PGE45_09470 [Actinomyces oris]